MSSSPYPEDEDDPNNRLTTKSGARVAVEDEGNGDERLAGDVDGNVAVAGRGEGDDDGEGEGEGAARQRGPHGRRRRGRGERGGDADRAPTCDTFAPLGPWVVSADEVGDVHDLRIQLRLNGTAMQDSSTRELVFGVPALLESIASTITLEPGDVILTGTPAGVGFARRPPVYLKAGDVVEVEIEGLGGCGIQSCARRCYHEPFESPSSVRLQRLPIMTPLDSFGTRTTIQAGGEAVYIWSLRVLERAGFPAIGRLPYSLKVLHENLLRNEDGRYVTRQHIEALARWDPTRGAMHEIAFTPARVLLQDFTGVPAVVDLAAMRDAHRASGW